MVLHVTTVLLRVGTWAYLLTGVAATVLRTGVLIWPERPLVSRENVPLSEHLESTAKSSTSPSTKTQLPAPSHQLFLSSVVAQCHCQDYIQETVTLKLSTRMHDMWDCICCDGLNQGSMHMWTGSRCRCTMHKVFEDQIQREAGISRPQLPESSPPVSAVLVIDSPVTIKLSRLSSPEVSFSPSCLQIVVSLWLSFPQPLFTAQEPTSHRDHDLWPKSPRPRPRRGPRRRPAGAAAETPLGDRHGHGLGS